MPTLEQLGIIAGIVLAVATFLHTIFKFGGELSKVKERVDIMWEFLMRRAISQAVNKGFGKMNSPIIISKEAQDLFTKLQSELQNFYQKKGFSLSDGELMFQIEKFWGDRIVKEVCIPNNMTEGECLVIAAAVAKQNNGIALNAKRNPSIA